MTKFLFKANNEILSHCNCENEPAISEGQMDCPWCGCGWLISCSRCGKAFTLAEIRETNISMEELGRREAAARGLSNISEDNIRDWAGGMTEALAPFAVGDIVIYLDGCYWNIEAENIKFDGYFASHDFDQLPHAKARNDPEALRGILGNVEYWTDRELPDRE